MNSDFTLVDSTIAALGNIKRGIEMPKDQHKDLQAIRRSKTLRKSLREATRYTLDDDLLEYIVRLSITIDADDLVERYKTFAPPHKKTFIEWDEKKRVLFFQNATQDLDIGEFEEPDLNILADKVGYFFEEFLNPSEPYDGDGWMATQFASTGSQKIVTYPLSIQFYEWLDGNGLTYEHEHWLYEYSDVDWNKRNHQEEIDAYYQNLIPHLFSEWWFQTNNCTSKNSPIKSLANHIRLPQGHAIEFFVDIDAQFDSNIIRYFLHNSKNIFNGDVRFLITLFSVLNYPWIIKEDAQVSTQRKYQYGGFHRGNSQIELKIDLPKLKGVTIKVKDFQKAFESSRRQHTVRGHFRKLPDGRMIRVKEHIRGNAKLGIITKDYTLTHTGAY